MQSQKIVRLGLLLMVTVAGVWALAARGSLAQETALRQRALRRAMAPAGVEPGAPTGVAGANDHVYDPIAPVAVALADVPAGQYAPHNTYDAWQRGAIDLDETEARVSRAELLALQEEAMDLAPSANVQIAAGGPQAPTATVSFDAIDVSECCGGGTSVPPDSDMAAGPNHLIAVVNVAFEIYDKSGATLVAPTTFASFFSSLPDCVAGPSGAFDPTVVYDEEADRFAIGVDGNGTDFCIAVSQSGDPTGAWWLYAVPADLSGAFHDYPHIGVGQDAIYVGANQFGGSLPGGFEGRVWALDKWDMYNGDPLTPQTASLGFEGTPQPLHLHGWQQGTWPSGGPYYFITDPYDGDTLTLWEWNNALSGAAPTVKTTFNLQTATGVASAMPVDAPQLGGSNIQANDYRFRGFEYRNGYGWTTDSISCNPGGGTVDCVRWAQIDLTQPTPALVQAGVYASSGEYRTFPDVAANHCNDAAIGYSKLSSSTYPSVWYTGRQSGDAPGTLQAEALLKAGEVTYTSFDGPPHRWGDYSGMTIDPDGVTFWYMGEYSKNVAPGPAAKWGNYIGAFTYPDCSTAADFSISAIPTAQDVCIPDDAAYDVEVTSLAGFSDPVTLSASGEPAGSSVSFSTNPITPTDTTTMTIGTAGTSAGSYNVEIAGVALTRTHTTTVGLDLYASAPGAVSLLGPGDGAVNQPVLPQLSWTAVADATGYLVEVATDGGFTNVVESATVTGTSYQVAAPLAENTTHYWRVTAQNVCGDSAASPTYSFTTIGDTIACAAGTSLVTGYSETFASGAAGWSHDAAVGPDTWVITDTMPGPGSGGNAWYAEDYAAPADQRLTSPAIDLPAGYDALMLQFWNEQDFEDPAGSGGCWDGGLLEISTDGGGTWTLLEDELLNDPYDGDGNNGPPAGLPLWCGETDGFQAWTNAIVDLDAYAGQQVRFRFRSLSDAATGAPGWLIDDVRVTYCAGPQIDVDPAAIDSAQTPGETVTRTLTISNTGGGSLDWTLFEQAAASSCSGSADIPWASAAPTGGTVTAASSAPVTVTLNATGYASGVYTGTLCIDSNDTANPQVAVPLTMTVGSFGVALSGDATQTAPPGATVTYTLALTNTGTLPDTVDLALSGGSWPTSVDGPTSVPLAPGASSAVTVVVSIPAAAGGSSNVVYLTATSQGDASATESARLQTYATALFPQIAVDPGAISATLLAGAQVTRTITISNLGQADLDWSLFEEPATVAPAAPPGHRGAIGPDAFAPVAPQADVVQDGSFEAGTPNPYWDEGSTNFGTPICDAATCPPGNASGPRSGDYWVWFGGKAIGVEAGFVTQDVTIPAGRALLSFWLEIPSAAATGFMEVRMGGASGTTVFAVTHADASAYATYQQVFVDLSAYADGGTHTLAFVSETNGNGSGTLDFFVDDIALEAAPLDNCLSPGQIPWASAAPTTGAVIPGGSVQLAVSLDATGYASGVYTGTLCVESNDYQNPVVAVPLTMTVSGHYGVALGADAAQTGAPGTAVTYTLAMTNTGTLADTYDLALSGNAWPAAIAGPATVALGPGASADVTVVVSVPAIAAVGQDDAVTLTATSQNSPGVSDSATLTTTSGYRHVFLPLISKR